MFEYLALMFIFTLPFSVVAFLHFGWRRMLKLAALFFPFGFAWDWIAAVYLHIWYWNPDKTVGVWFAGLPLEEYLFFVLLPWMLVGIYRVAKYIFSFWGVKYDHWNIMGNNRKI